MIFTYLQCLIDCRDCLVLVSPIKTRFLATVGSFLYFISYYIFFRNKTISNYTVNFYLYDKLELALSFNSPPPLLSHFSFYEIMPDSFKKIGKVQRQ